MEESAQPRKAARLSGGRQPGAGRKKGDKHDITVPVSGQVRKLIQRYRPLPGEQGAYIEAAVLFYEAHKAASKLSQP